MEFGRVNKLKYMRSTPQGVYLENEAGEEVLLPNKFVTDDMEVDDLLDVFVYLDSEDRPVATTQTPLIQLNEFNFLKVKDANNIGAFMDWGLDKDLLVPFRNQKAEFESDRYYLIYLYFDEQSQRLAGTNKFQGILHSEEPHFERGQKVTALLCDKTDLGINCIIDNTHVGMIYHDEIFDIVKRGEKRDVYIKKVREDGKIDLSIEPLGAKRLEPNAEKVLKYITKNGGSIKLTDKSSPDLIFDELKMSKRAFKDALGILYKNKRVILSKTETKLA